MTKKVNDDRKRYAVNNDGNGDKKEVNNDRKRYSVTKKANNDRKRYTLT